MLGVPHIRVAADERILIAHNNFIIIGRASNFR